MKPYLFAFLAILFTNNVFATTYYISPTGNDANNGISMATAFLTIQHATDLVIAGDSVLVADGNYTGFNHLNKNSGTQQIPIVYNAMGNNVVINAPKYNNNGINIENNDYIEVHGFKVKRMSKEGIRAVHANGIVLKNNNCDSCFRGIFTGYTDDIIVEHNTCTRSHGEHGIYISNNSDNITLRYNSCSYNARSGIQINPDLSSGTPGISVGTICTYNKIFENKLGAGLNFQGLDGALIANNLIYNNHSASGLTLFLGDAATGCKNVKVYNNTILVPADGRWGIHIVDFASNITIYNNILINLNPVKGAIALQPNSYTQTNIVSDYNVVTNRFCEIDDACNKTLSQWQALGYDANSLLAPSLLTDLFVSPVTNDYHQNATALSIDAGSNLVSAQVVDDYDLLPRPKGAGYDIGAYEKNVSTSVNDYKLLSLVEIYPNPAKDKINIKGLNQKCEVEIIIINVAGAEVFSYKNKGVTNIEFPIGQLVSGIYFIQIKNGLQTTEVKKFVVQY